MRMMRSIGIRVARRTVRCELEVPEVLSGLGVGEWFSVGGVVALVLKRLRSPLSAQAPLGGATMYAPPDPLYFPQLAFNFRKGWK